jgi:MoxR-like ATPase
MIGRDHEIGEITCALADDAVRGVALAGKAGVGKSRLAREAVAAADRRARPNRRCRRPGA